MEKSILSPLEKLKTLSEEIDLELGNLGTAFSSYLKELGLQCPPQCGQCCINPEISCSPYELLPLAFKLLELGDAEEYLAKAKNEINNICIFLKFINKEEGLGFCSKYEFRPLVCRAFGAAARKNKFAETELVLCPKFKVSEPILENLNAPHLESAKKVLESLHPSFFEPQINLNKALIIVLEKLLLIKKFENLDSKTLN